MESQSARNGEVNRSVQLEADLIELTTNIVTAYVGNNPVPSSELPRLIADIHAAIASVVAGAVPQQPVEKPVPVISIRKSVTPDFLICLEDGKKFKSLKRHLATHHGLTPDEYQQKWNLPANYPMVAPTYSAARSAMAKSMGARLREGLLDRTNTSKSVWADTAYRSNANEVFMDKQGFISRVHRKKPKGRRMPEVTRRSNNQKSKVRSRVEHVFAEQKSRMGLFVRTIGIERATTKIGLANILYNMKRLIYLDRIAIA